MWFCQILVWQKKTGGCYYLIESLYLTHEVSTYPWGQVSTARGQNYYIEFKHLTHEVSTHHWGQISSARGQYNFFKSKYLRPSFYCKRLVLLPWVPVADTMMSKHITEAKFLLLEVSTTTLSPSFCNYDVSTRDWGKVSTARGLYYYIESQYLTHEVSTHHWGQVSTAKGLLYIESQNLTPWCQYTWLRQSFYCWRSLLLHWVPVSDTRSKNTSLRPSFYC